MSTFRVWAPLAIQMSLELRGRSIAMEPAEGGWWQAKSPAAAGEDYAFRIDGGQPLPDPRSPWQPNGVNGFSRLVDHSAFAWTDDAWKGAPLESAFIYELHTGTFTPEGTFSSAISKFDYLRDLGITHLELMPVNQFSGPHGWGYDGVDIFAPHNDYGGPDGLKRLIDACHARGLGVILDVVYNHFGPDGCYLGQFGPYFTKDYSNAWGQAVNFDGPYSDEVRRFIVDNALMWLRDYHFDGLRIDGVHAIIDTSAVHIMEQLATEVTQLQAILGRHLFLIAESSLNDPRLIRPIVIGGYGLDAQWNDDFHHSLHIALTGEHNGYYADFEGMPDLAAVFKTPFLFTGRYSATRRRRHGRPPIGLPGSSFLAYIQDHDQIGNRARGERISHLAGPQRAKLAAAMVITAPYIPMFFMGEEWAASSPFQFFTSFASPQLASAVREGRTREFTSFGWRPEDIPDPQDPKTFAASKLKWPDLAAPPHRDMLEWYRRLIHLRKTTPDLKDNQLDRVEVRCDIPAGWLAVYRGSISVLANFSDSAVRIPLEPARPRSVLLTSAQPSRLDDMVELPPCSVTILGPHQPSAE